MYVHPKIGDIKFNRIRLTNSRKILIYILNTYIKCDSNLLNLIQITVCYSESINE